MDLRKLACVLAVPLALAACGDGNVFDGASGSSNDDASRMERAVDALNAENWDEAIALLEGLDASDPDVRKYLASAYVGRAGFDTLTLVELVVKADEAGQDTDVYDTITQVFADTNDDGAISSVDLSEKKEDVEAALSVVTADGVAVGDDKDEVFQAGVYAALHAVILMGEVVDAEDVSRDGVSQMDSAQLAESVTQGYTGEVQAKMEEDLWLVTDAVGVVLDNDVTQEFDEFLSEAGFDDGTVTSQELTQYLDSL